MANHSSVLKTLERWLLIPGLALLIVCGAVLVYRAVSSRSAIREFEQARNASSVPVSASEAVELRVEDQADFGTWSEKRAQAYRQSISEHKGAPLAVLSIERLKIRVAVFDGTDELNLNRGVGWIAGTAKPGEKGNIGIAGHRDGFFRGLKDAAVGDDVELTTARGAVLYRIDQIEIVTPGDVRVLAPRAAPSLTLVTCYPFYFVGSAPKRYIVHASLQNGS